MRNKDFVIETQPLTGRIWVISDGEIQEFHPVELGLTTDDILHMSEEEIKCEVLKHWRD